MPYYRILQTFTSLSEKKRYKQGDVVMLTKKKAEKWKGYLIEDKQLNDTK